MSEKKANQLGMSGGKAYNRLLKDIMWWLIIESGKYNCCRCGDTMSREDFSIEHIEPWLDTDDPVKLFFSLENIGFSHLKCNIDARRVSGPLRTDGCGTISMFNRGCRCNKCVEAKAQYRFKNYDKDLRAAKYKRNGT